MDKYINAEPIIDELKDCVTRLEKQQGNLPTDADNFINDVQIKVLKIVLDMINQTPAADVQEVKHGRFIPDNNLEYLMKQGMPIFNGKCSECGSYCFDTDTYCADCGARMDGDAK